MSGGAVWARDRGSGAVLRESVAGYRVVRVCGDVESENGAGRLVKHAVPVLVCAGDRVRLQTSE